MSILRHVKIYKVRYNQQPLVWDWSLAFTYLHTLHSTCLSTLLQCRNVEVNTYICKYLHIYIYIGMYLSCTCDRDVVPCTRNRMNGQGLTLIRWTMALPRRPCPNRTYIHGYVGQAVN